MYRLIATDLDGTLLNGEKKVSAASAAAVKAAMNSGVHFVIATGRPLEGIMRVAGELDLLRPGQYAIVFNGAAVYELGPVRQLTGCRISGREVRGMAERGAELGVNFHAFSAARGLLAPAPNRWTDVEMAINGIGCTVTDFAAIPDDEEFLKFMFCGEAGELGRVAARIDDYRQTHTVTRSAFCFLEVLHRDASKGNGLKMLCETVGVAREETVAFGDEQNDISMLEYAGLGVAMANAVPEVKRAADLITASNDRDGLARAVNAILADRNA